MMPATPLDRRNRIFIGGISDRITKQDIESEFGRFGKLTNVWVAQNPPGFAFVEYDHISEADLAVNEMNGKPFLGSTNKIRVEHSHGGKSRRRAPGGFNPRNSSFNSRGGRNDRFGGGSPGYRNGGGGGGPGGFNRRDGGPGAGFGNGGGGRFMSDDGDRRRPFPSGTGGTGRFHAGPPRYGGRNDQRGYGGGPRRSRSPVGGRKYHQRGMEPMSHNFSPVGAGGYQPNIFPY